MRHRKFKMKRGCTRNIKLKFNKKIMKKYVVWATAEGNVAWLNSNIVRRWCKKYSISLKKEV